MSEEILVLVDEADRPIGRAPRSRVRRERLLHRGTAILVRNGRGQVLVHRRTDTKDIYPGLWDLFVGGAVPAGESYEETARRETTEEAGIAQPALEFLFTYHYPAAENPCWIGVFETRCDGRLCFQPEEVAEGEFVDEAGLEALLAERNFVPESVLIWREYLRRRDSA